MLFGAEKVNYSVLFKSFLINNADEIGESEPKELNCKNIDYFSSKTMS